MPPSDGFDGRAADIWSLGITLFTYIATELPFVISSKKPNINKNSNSNNVEGKEEEQKQQQQEKGEESDEISLMRSILHDQLPEFKEPVSDELKDLLAKMTCKDPNKRITIQEYLEHSWFSSF